MTGRAIKYDLSFPGGRSIPPDWEHVEKYPVSKLRAVAAPSITNGVFGINWYRAFTESVRKIDGKMVIGSQKRWGALDGGHAIRALKKDYAEKKRISVLYDQRTTPRCVGYSTAAELTDMRGVLIDPDQTYHDAQEFDSIPGHDYDGTEIRAAFDAFRTIGPALEGKPGERGEKIDSYYWCRNDEEIWRTLGYDDNDEMIALRQTWHSSGYPDTIWIPRTAVIRLMGEAGEFGFMLLAAA